MPPEVNNPQTTNKVPTIGLLISTLALALLIGGVFFVLDKKISQTNSNLNSRLTAVEKKLTAPSDTSTQQATATYEATVTKVEEDALNPILNISVQLKNTSDAKLTLLMSEFSLVKTNGSVAPVGYNPNVTTNFNLSTGSEFGGSVTLVAGGEVIVIVPFSSTKKGEAKTLVIEPASADKKELAL